MKGQKKAIELPLLFEVLSSTAMAATQADQIPMLSFSGTTANCSVNIKAFGKYIDATLELCRERIM